MNQIIQGDCLEKLKDLEDNSIDAVVTDPPAGISFMGKEWDTDKGGRDCWIKWMQEVATECSRVLKPGGHALVWTIPRTSHWTATAWENAGFQVRDVVAHIFGSGFPKSLDIGKKIDKMQGNKREVIGRNPNSRENCDKTNTLYESGTVGKTDILTKGNSEFEGFGTALKPAREDWLLMRNPIEKGLTVAENCLKWGTGGINIDECRVEYQGQDDWNNTFRPSGNIDKNCWIRESNSVARKDIINRSGRFPANLIHDGSDEVVGLFPQTGKGGYPKLTKDFTGKSNITFRGSEEREVRINSDSGSASRFFKECKQEELCDLCFSVRYDTMSICKNTNVNNVEKNLITTQATSGNTVPLNVEDSQEEQLVQLVRSVGNLCEQCGTLIVQELVKIKSLDFKTEESQVIQDFIGNYKKCILLQNLVQFAEQMENIDTTQTTKNLLKLFGSANLVITNYIKEIRKSEPSRFKYTPKASKSERNKGCEGLEEKQQDESRKEGNPGGDNPRNRGVHKVKNHHPTVKPIALMEYLVKLVSREGATVLDPFAGSGSTLIACKNLNRNYIGIELDPEYCKIAEARLKEKQKRLL